MDAEATFLYAPISKSAKWTAFECGIENALFGYIDRNIAAKLGKTEFKEEEEEKKLIKMGTSRSHHHNYSSHRVSCLDRVRCFFSYYGRQMTPFARARHYASSIHIMRMTKNVTSRKWRNRNCITNKGRTFGCWPVGSSSLRIVKALKYFCITFFCFTS